MDQFLISFKHFHWNFHRLHCLFISLICPYPQIDDLLIRHYFIICLLVRTHLRRSLNLSLFWSQIHIHRLGLKSHYRSFHCHHCFPNFDLLSQHKKIKNCLHDLRCLLLNCHCCLITSHWIIIQRIQFTYLKISTQLYS